MDQERIQAEAHRRAKLAMKAHEYMEGRLPLRIRLFSGENLRSDLSLTFVKTMERSRDIGLTEAQAQEATKNAMKNEIGSIIVIALILGIIWDILFHWWKNRDSDGNIIISVPSSVPK